MKIPGITNEQIFAAHKECWDLFQAEINKIIEDGMFIENLDITSDSVSFEESRTFNVRIKLVRNEEQSAKIRKQKQIAIAQEIFDEYVGVNEGKVNTLKVKDIKPTAHRLEVILVFEDDTEMRISGLLARDILKVENYRKSIPGGRSDTQPHKWKEELLRPTPKTPQKPDRDIHEKPTRTIRLWTEGYRATGQSSGAVFHGVFQAVDLRDAVEQFKETLTDQHSKDCVNVNRLTFWGCRFFDNETDARRSFG